jgi:hypothetical protein
MTASGHEEKAPPPRLSGCYRLVEPTFAGMGGKEKDASNNSLVDLRVDGSVAPVPAPSHSSSRTGEDLAL